MLSKYFNKISSKIYLSYINDNKKKDSTNLKIPLKTVSFEKGFIFIHIPKNAGTSIAKSLGLTKTAHHTSREIQQILDYVDFAKLFKFAFVRNPWDRFISLYNYARLEESYYHSAINPEKSLHGKHLDYDLLKNASLKECAYFLIEGKLKHDKYWNQWSPQYTWITDINGNQLVDYLGKIENIEQDFIYITKRLGLDSKLDFCNSSTNKVNSSFLYRDIFDKETQQIVSKFYQKDIELFGYEF